MNKIWPSSVAVLVPAYNAVHHLNTFLTDLCERVPREQILIVDDASVDGTARYCTERGFRVISHEINRGKGAALRTGFAALTQKSCDWIITMDADGQHRPEDLDGFLAAITSYPHSGLIIGNREKVPGTMPLARIFSNRLTSAIMGLYCGVPIQDVQCGYRAYSTAMLARITITYDRFEMESEVVLKCCHLPMDVRFVPVKTVYSPHISSHISHIRDTYRWVVAVVKTSSVGRRS